MKDLRGFIKTAIREFILEQELNENKVNIVSDIFNNFNDLSKYGTIENYLDLGSNKDIEGFKKYMNKSLYIAEESIGVNKSLLIKENLENDIEFYFNHLKDDDFFIQSETDYIRIFKPTLFSGVRPVYSYSSCRPFQWKEVSGDLDRFISEIGKENISYISGVKKTSGSSVSYRFQILEEQVHNQEFDCGEIISVTVGFIDEL